MFSGFRDLPSVLPVNQELSFAFQISDDITELPHLALFDSFQSEGISHFWKILKLSYSSGVI